MDQWVNTKRASEITGYTETWLRQQRFNRKGPPYSQDGPRSNAMYKVADLVEWMNARRIEPVYGEQHANG